MSNLYQLFFSPASNKSDKQLNTLLTGMQALCDCGSIDKISGAQVTHDVFI